MALVDTLNTALQQVAANIVAMTANPKPTYQVGDRNISHTEYLQMLIDEQKILEQSIQRATGPLYLQSIARP